MKEWKNAIGYYRASSEESQRRQYNAIPRQKDRVRDWCKNSSFRLLKEFEDRSTGTSFDRPEFASMWKFAKANKKIVDYIICTDVTRFGREGAEYLAWFKNFQKIGIEVNFCEEWFDFSIPEMYGLFYYRIGSAEAESLRIGKRTRDTKMSMRKQGYYADTAPAPWKYSPLRDNNGRKILIKNEPAFTYYQRAIKLFLQKDLTQSEIIGIVSDKEYRIKSSTFSRLLRNPLIAGFIPIWDYSVGKITQRPLLEMIPSSVPPIVSLKEFKILQAKLEKVNSPKLKSQQLSFNEKFPLKKYALCPDCKKPLRAYMAKGRSKTYLYYDCFGTKHFRIKGEELMKLLQEFLNKLTVKESEAKHFETAINKALSLKDKSRSNQVAELRKALNKVGDKIKKLKSDFLKIDAELFQSLLQEFKMEKADLEIKLSDLSKLKDLTDGLKRSLLTKVNNLGDWFLDATPFQQRELVRMVFPKGFYVKNNELRTRNINLVISLLFSVSSSYGGVSNEGQEDLPFILRGGGGGIRTPGTISRTPVFKTGAFNQLCHSSGRCSLVERLQK